MGMSSFDIYAEVKELQSILNARVNKIFQVTESELKFVLHTKDGKKHLVIEAGKRIHLTQYPKPSPKTPSMFTMALRKYIGNAIIKGIKQVGFDRIVEIEFSKGDNTYILVAELFGNGNVLLLNSNREILAVMKPKRYSTRDVVTRAVYQPPPQRVNPLEITAEEIYNIVKEAGREVVKTLATTLGLGGMYAEEICARAEMDKKKKEISKEEAEKIWEKIQEFKNSVGREKPIIIFHNETPELIAPFKLKIHSDKKIKEYSSMDEALDAFFTTYEFERAEAERRKKFEEKLSKLRARLKQQALTLKKYYQGEKKYREMGDLIYQNYSLVEKVLEILKKARERYSWNEIREILKKNNISLVKDIMPESGKVVVVLNSENIQLDLRKNVFENAEHYYLRAKKFKEKQAGALIAVRKTSAEIQKLIKAGVEAIESEKPLPKKTVMKKKEWYEKFRWFFSSEGFLVLGGRDAVSNEVLFKKHCSPNDIFIHADIHGAPVVIIKTQGKPVGESTIQEAFDFAASYSRAWKHGYASIEVYWVNPEQVSKQAESGEYLARGAFVIRGKRNYGVGRTEIAVGVKFNEEAKLIAGPVSAIAKQSDVYVVVVPGRKKSLELAKEIKSRFIALAKEEHKPIARKINHDDIQKLLPPGTGEVKA